MSMHIRPPSATPLSVTKQTQTSGSDFHDTLKSKAKSTEAILSPWIQDLGRLSQNMKAGKVSQQEACQKFVEWVTSNRMDLGRFSQNTKEIEQAVIEVLGQDPQFMRGLETQLKKLT